MRRRSRRRGRVVAGPARSRVWSVLEGATGPAARRRPPPGSPRARPRADGHPARRHSRPMPVIPARLRSTSRVPQASCAPVPAPVSAPAAAAVSASAAASRKNGSHRPVWRSGLADRACGGDGDGHRGPGLEHQRQLQRAVGVPVPEKRDPQPDGAGRYCRRGRRLAACSRSSRIPAQGGRASPAVRPGAAVVGTVGAVRAVMAAVPG